MPTQHDLDGDSLWRTIRQYEHVRDLLADLGRYASLGVGRNSGTVRVHDGLRNGWSFEATVYEDGTIDPDSWRRA